MMASYAAELTVEERWAVVAYIRALQLSQSDAGRRAAAGHAAAAGGAAAPARTRRRPRTAPSNTKRRSGERRNVTRKTPADRTLNSSRSGAAALAHRRRRPARRCVLSLISLIGARDEPQDACYSYLVAFAYWAGSRFASVILLMIFHATHARWMTVLRRPVEAMAATIAVFILLFIPLGLGLKHVYVWVDPAAEPGPARRSQLHRRTRRPS